MAIEILLLIAGLVLVLVGAEALVDGASGLARRWGISEFVIGLTIVAIGTSAPEMVVSFISSIEKNSDLAVGNIIGSNIFNILLILGGSALITPLSFADISYIDLGALIASALALFACCYVGEKNKLDRVDGVIFLVLFVAYMTYLIVQL